MAQEVFDINEMMIDGEGKYLTQNNGKAPTISSCDKECQICKIDRCDWYFCKRCSKSVCIDCRNHDIEVHDSFPCIIYTCSFCRHKQQIDEIEYEHADYYKVDKSTLAKMCLLYKNSLKAKSNCYDSDSE